MIQSRRDVAERIRPYISVSDLNQPIPVASGSFRLVGPVDAVLSGELLFRWLPSSALEFDGTCAGADPDISAPNWFLESVGDVPFRVSVFLTYVAPGPEASRVRGIVQQGFSAGQDVFDSLRFCLVNFPEYIGAPVSYDADSQGGFAGRLQLRADVGECRLDAIPETAGLAKRARRDAGFVMSHVGHWIPASGTMTSRQAEVAIQLLHFWFGFLRGAWAGPVFPQGLAKSSVAWRQFAAWRVGESPSTPTWFPQRTPLDLSSAFRGFSQRWDDPAWQDALISAVSWFVEANSPRAVSETRIVFAQVALELLAWIYLVETQPLHSRTDFKRLSAAGRIRILLQQLRIPSSVPDYLHNVPAFDDRDAFDGPGVITAVRNALVHASDQKRKVMARLDGRQRYQCAQLALHYLELVLLAVCGHDGYYARRGWEGWKGEDEVPVPWISMAN